MKTDLCQASLEIVQLYKVSTLGTGLESYLRIKGFHELISSYHKLRVRMRKKKCLEDFSVFEEPNIKSRENKRHIH